MKLATNTFRGDDCYAWLFGADADRPEFFDIGRSVQRAIREAKQRWGGVAGGWAHFLAEAGWEKVSDGGAHYTVAPGFVILGVEDGREGAAKVAEDYLPYRCTPSGLGVAHYDRVIGVWMPPSG